MVIEVPPKVWQPKIVNKYKMPEYEDVDNGVFEFQSYGNCVFRNSFVWDAGSRADIIDFDDDRDTLELQRDLHIGKLASPTDKLNIKNLVKTYWDCFCEQGCHRHILGYEFGIDTGTHTPVCCRKPSYGFHESAIIKKELKKLRNNRWIRRCAGPWGSLIVLAAKPHQEHVSNIDDFVWRLCVSYRALNRITKPFQFPIPRCDDSVYLLGNGSVKVFFITLDAR